MEKLYMISLGGKVEGANIEVHDVQFAIGESVEETIQIVKNNWYGNLNKLHLDSYKEIKGADGYKISLSKEKIEGSKHLYFVYIGWYDINSTQEKHEVELVVCESEEEAKEKATSTVIVDKIERHVDSVVKVEDVILSLDNEKYYLSYEQTEETFDTSPDWYGYRKI